MSVERGPASFKATHEMLAFVSLLLHAHMHAKHGGGGLPSLHAMVPLAWGSCSQAWPSHCFGTKRWIGNAMHWQEKDTSTNGGKRGVCLTAPWPPMSSSQGEKDDDVGLN